MAIRFTKSGLFRTAIVVACLACMVPPATGQHPIAPPQESSQSANFAPLERWRQAVLAGDMSALQALYVSGRPAFAATPDGRMAEPAGEESKFWSSLAPNGLIAISPKILEQTAPQGAVKLMLRIELTFRSEGRDDRRLVSGEQIWSQQDGNWRILITRRSDLEPLVSYQLIEPAKPNPHLYPDVQDAQKDIDAALKVAREDHRGVLVIFGANWCYPCQVLDATIQSKDVAPLIAAKYHLVHVNVGDGDGNQNLAERYRASIDRGIPQFVFLESDGTLRPSKLKGNLQLSTETPTKELLALLDLASK